jgi:hypothetical protein
MDEFQREQRRAAEHETDRADQKMEAPVVGVEMLLSRPENG